MGQRSQIYVRYNKGNEKGLIANYYGWNYGDLMISRARWGIYNILKNLQYSRYYMNESNVTKLSRILDTNFDMHDIATSCDIIEEFHEQFPEKDFNDFVFLKQDNNDGKLFIDICDDVVKYAFLDKYANSDNIMDGEAYMCWDNCKEWRENEYFSSEDVKICEENIKFISENATLMTKEEVEEFINYNYTC